MGVVLEVSVLYDFVYARLTMLGWFAAALCALQAIKQMHAHKDPPLAPKV